MKHYVVYNNQIGTIDLAVRGSMLPEYQRINPREKVKFEAEGKIIEVFLQEVIDYSIYRNIYIYKK